MMLATFALLAGNQTTRILLILDGLQAGIVIWKLGVEVVDCKPHVLRNGLLRLHDIFSIPFVLLDVKG